MKKEALFSIIFTILLINLVSAQVLSGFTNIIESLDPDAVTFALIFLVTFAFLNIGLGNVFSTKNIYGGSEASRLTPIISLLLAFGITYSIYQTNWDVGGIIENLFFEIGIDTEIIPLIFGIILLIGILYLLWKFGFTNLLIFAGLTLLLLSLLTDVFYEKEITSILGLILLLLGLWLAWRNWRKKRQASTGGVPPSSNPRKEQDPFERDVTKALQKAEEEAYIEKEQREKRAQEKQRLERERQEQKKRRAEEEAYIEKEQREKRAQEKQRLERERQEQQERERQAQEKQRKEEEHKEKERKEKRAQEQKQEQKKSRNLIDLKYRYGQYLQELYRKKKKSSIFGNRNKRLLKAMKLIIKEAKKQGMSQMDFLSSKVGRVNYQPPEHYGQTLEQMENKQEQQKQIQKQEEEKKAQEQEEKRKETEKRDKLLQLKFNYAHYAQRLFGSEVEENSRAKNKFLAEMKKSVAQALELGISERDFLSKKIGEQSYETPKIYEQLLEKKRKEKADEIKKQRKIEKEQREKEIEIRQKVRKTSEIVREATGGGFLLKLGLSTKPEKQLSDTKARGISVITEKIQTLQQERKDQEKRGKRGGIKESITKELVEKEIKSIDAKLDRLNKALKEIKKI